MIEIEITTQQIARAEHLYQFGALNNSITQGANNIFGAVGEIVVFDYFNTTTTIDFTSTFDFDMIVNGFKIDVKTRVCKNEPTQNFWLDIPASNTTQRCDFFFFVFVLQDLTRAFLAGYIRPEQFFSRATFIAKDTRADHGFVYRCDSYTLKASEVNKFNAR